MDTFCMVMFLLCFLGIFVFAAWFVIRLIKKLLKRTDKRAPRLLLGSVACFILMIVFACIAPDTDYTPTEDEVVSAEDEISTEPEVIEEEVSVEPEVVEKEESSDTETTSRAGQSEDDDTEEVAEADIEDEPEESVKNESEETNVDNLSESEYKALCQEMWYDEIFFSEDNLKGEYVKLDVFLEEARYFESTATSDSTYQELDEVWNLHRNFFYAGVLREDTNSYVGGQITILFSQDYDVNPVNYLEGDKLIIYGQIARYSTITKDGYNYCIVVPKYVETK